MCSDHRHKLCLLLLTSTYFSLHFYSLERENDHREITTATLGSILREPSRYHQIPIQNFERPGRVLKQHPQEYQSNALKIHSIKGNPKQSFQSVDEYDYYDEGDIRLVGKANSKVCIATQFSLCSFIIQFYQNSYVFLITGKGCSARCRNY